MFVTVSNRHELKAGQANDSILQDNDDRWVIFPIQYHNVWGFFKKTETFFWTAEDISLTNEARDYLRQANDAQIVLKNLIIYELAANGGIFPDYLDLTSQSLIETTIPEARAYGGFHGMKEIIHKEVFSNVSQIFIPDIADRAAIGNTLMSHPAVVAKKAFVSRHIDSEAPFAERLLAMAIMKRVFSATCRFVPIALQFALGSFDGWHQASLHVTLDDWIDSKFNGLLHSMLSVQINTSDVTKLVNEAMKIEVAFAKAFVPDSVLGGVIGDDLEAYIEYVARLVESDFTRSKDAMNGTFCKFASLSEQKLHEMSVIEHSAKNGAPISAANANPIASTAAGSSNKFSLNDDF